MLLSLDNHVLLHLMSFLPDAESIIRCSRTCKRIHDLTTMEEEPNDDEEQTVHVWEALDRKLNKMVGKPETSTARDRVRRFAAASNFAKKVEALAPAHHYSLKEHSCPGCSDFPDAPKRRDDLCYLCEDQEKDEERSKNYQTAFAPSRFFVRLTVDGKFIWEGFLSARYGGNGSIYLTLAGEADFQRLSNGQSFNSCFGNILNFRLPINVSLRFTMTWNSCYAICLIDPFNACSRAGKS